MKLILIAAVSRNGMIGNKNGLPWNVPKDLEHFKNTTRGFTVIMGRKTFESIGRPLPKRRNIVLTRNADFKPAGVEIFPSWDEALSTVQNEEKVFCVGGGEIYKQLLPKADEVILSELEIEVDGDTAFPDFKDGAFQNVDFVKASELAVEDLIPFKIVHYKKI